MKKIKKFKEIKRLIAGLLAVGMCGVSTITGFAAIANNAIDPGYSVVQTMPGWSIATKGFTNFTDAAIVSEAGYGGGNALYLNSIDDSQTTGDINAYCESIGMLYGGTYEISWKFKFLDYSNDNTVNKVGANLVDVKTTAGNALGFDVFFGANGAGTMNSWGTGGTNKSATVTELDDGWYSVTYKKEVTKDTNASAVKNSNKYRYLKIRLNQHAGGAEVYVDDVKVSRVDADGNAISENLVYNGDFEVTKTTGVAKSEYDARDVVVGEFNGSLELSWANPTNANLSNVSLYDITDVANPSLLSSALSTTPGARVRYSVNGIEEKSVHYYKAVFTFSSGKVSETIIAGCATTKTQKILDTADYWRYVALGTDSAATRLVNAEIDKSVKHSGDASLHISTGFNSTEESAYNTGIRIESQNVRKIFSQTSGIVPGDYVLFSFWAKTDNVGYYQVYLNNQLIGAANTTAAGTTNNDEAYGIKGTLRSNDWTYFEGKLKKPVAADLEKQFALLISFYGSQAANIWLDDFQMYPCDASGVITPGATNLIAADKYDAGFEVSCDALDKILGSAPKNVSATGGNGTVTVSWAEELTAAGNTAAIEHKKIYFINSAGEYIYKGKAYKGCTSMTFNNLENDVTYDIAVVNCARFGGESPATIVQAATVSPQYEIGEYQLFNGSTELDTVEAGTLTSKIMVKNNKVEAGLDVCFITAVYDSAYILKHVYVNEGATAGKISKGDEQTLINDNVVVETGDKLKTFLWNNLDDMLILKTMKEW